MKFLTTLIIILIGLVILAGISFFGYQFYQKLHAPAESPFKAIPQNSALIIKLNKPSLLWSQTKQTNELWKDLFSVPYLSALKHQINILDSAIHKNQKIGILIRNNPLFIIFSQTVSNYYGLLFMINIPTGVPEEDISEFIEKTWPRGITIDKSSYAGSSVYQVNDKSKKDPFFFATRNGIFIGSRQEILVKQAIDRLSLNLTSSEDQNFPKMVAISGKNVDANIFVNYQKIAPFMGSVFTNGTLSDYLNVSHFATWTGLDLIQKKEEWLVSGYTVCDDSSHEYLSHFSGQSPQNISMPGILPGNATAFTWIGLSDPGTYYQNLVSSKLTTSIYKSIYPNLLRIENILQTHLIDYFIPWTGNEIGLVTSPTSQNKDRNNVYGVFKVTDRNLADSLLQSLGNVASDQIQKETFKNHIIYTLNIPDLIPGIWGNLYQKLKGTAYTFLDDYIVFGNDPSSIKEFVEQVLSENVLTRNPDYLHFSEDLSDQSNLCYYFNTRQSFRELQSILSENINKEINPVIDSLKTFESLGIQIIDNGENFITNIFINHKTEEHSKGPLIWQTALDTLISGKPVIIMNAFKGKPAILAYDLANTMYLIDWNGNIQWKLKLPGQPVGDIYEIRPNKSDSVCFLFNTWKHICVVDNNGLFAYNSPFYLPLQAVTGLTCVELPSAGNYQIYLPLEDKKIYSFDVFGRQQVGWAKPAMNEFAAKPVQHLKVQGKDYFFTISRNGQVLITDIRGKPVVQPKSKIPFSTRSGFFLNKTNNKGPFLTSSREGKLLYLRNDGKTTDLKFNNFTQDHIFYYADINSDKIQEFIYFDLNKIYCYNRFQKLLYDYTFPSQILSPFMLKSPSGDILLGAVSQKSGDIYLFGKKGLLTVDRAIRGNTPFDLRIINPDLGTSLVIGTGKYVRNYLLSK
jgi:hypothetical protein